MIKGNEVESFLENRIGRNTNDLAKVWEVFKSFGKEQIDGGEETALLFQCGVYDFTGEELFCFDFVRQFTIEEEGHLVQLHCEFVFEPAEELSKLETSLMYFDYEGDVKDFYSEVESLGEFKIPLKYKPLRLNIYTEEI
ncbi:hypothetical protein [Sporosarcina sp. HYO08]|uniref:hypothetical protein n=1 Tax=Sporosarcina sp. HYO08 TaxID=1759557 RepID=UPI000794113C|nr:hypothetical protein [Sporosarcina sp. HYO08]KXH86076.1 hypothetical protein AU377_14805 [Sporosarcina sp. HYO08]